MADKLYEIVYENLGLIGFLSIAAVTAIVYLTVCCTVMFMKIKRIDNLPCDKHNSELKELEKLAVRLDEKFDRIDNLPCDKHNSELKELEKLAVSLDEKFDRIKDLPCDKHREDISKHERVMAKLETSVEYLGNEIGTAIRIFQRNNIGAEGYTKTMSPLTITKEGEEMIRRLKLDEMFERNWYRIKELVKRESESDAPYDVDKCCREQAVVFPEKFLGKEDIDILKDDAYHKGLLLTSYMKVVAVMARERYLSEGRK